MLQKGQKIELKIEKIVFGGEGLGFFNDFAVFVPMSVPGDLVEVEIISSKKTYARALITQILKPSSDRIGEGKISFEDFSGCDFAMINYSKQLELKKEMTQEVMSKIGKINEYELLKTIGADIPYHYRNKVIEPFAKSKGKIISGFYKKKSHDVFETDNNLLQPELANRILKKLKLKLNENKTKFPVYNEKTHRGFLRNVMVRTNSFSEAMLVPIVNSKKDSQEIRNLSKLLIDLSNELKEIKSIYISINPKKTNFVLGDENVKIHGDDYLKEELFGIKFNISPRSFFQINIAQTKKLYQASIDLFDNIENKYIVDAYSGTGTIAMILSSKAKHVYGIEMIEPAVKDAIKTASENNIDNVEFINGKVEDKLPEMLKENKKIDSIIFDPPRKGIQKNVLEAVNEAGIEEIVYISCNPSTFARDAEILENLGYKVQVVQPLDMFPQTNHIELAAKIVRKVK